MPSAVIQPKLRMCFVHCDMITLIRDVMIFFIIFKLPISKTNGLRTLNNPTDLMTTKIIPFALHGTL